jgi:AcrR family transcriptional regulator
MLAAMAEAMKENGYVGTPVAEIIRRAGVSRETFYQQFRSKQDCFIQALDTGAHILGAQLEQSAAQAAAPDRASARPPAEVFGKLLRLYLATLAEQPALARLFRVEVYAAGPEALARRGDVQRRFADAIAQIFRATSDEQRFGCEALVAAIAQMVTAYLVAEDLDGLRRLEEPLVRLAVRLLERPD